MSVKDLRLEAMDHMKLGQTCDRAGVEVRARPSSCSSALWVRSHSTESDAAGTLQLYEMETLLFPPCPGFGCKVKRWTICQKTLKNLFGGWEGTLAPAA